MNIYVYYINEIGESFCNRFVESLIKALPEHKIIDMKLPKYSDTCLQVKESLTFDTIRIFILPNSRKCHEYKLFKYYLNNAFFPIIINPKEWSQDFLRINLYKRRVRMSNKNNQFI